MPTSQWGWGLKVHMSSGRTGWPITHEEAANASVGSLNGSRELKWCRDKSVSCGRSRQLLQQWGSRETQELNKKSLDLSRFLLRSSSQFIVRQSKVPVQTKQLPVKCTRSVEWCCSCLTSDTIHRHQLSFEHVYRRAEACSARHPAFRFSFCTFFLLKFRRFSVMLTYLLRANCFG